MLDIFGKGLKSELRLVHFRLSLLGRKGASEKTQMKLWLCRYSPNPLSSHCIFNKIALRCQWQVHQHRTFFTLRIIQFRSVIRTYHRVNIYLTHQSIDFCTGYVWRCQGHFFNTNKYDLIWLNWLCNIFFKWNFQKSTYIYMCYMYLYIIKFKNWQALSLELQNRHETKLVEEVELTKPNGKENHNHYTNEGYLVTFFWRNFPAFSFKKATISIQQLVWAK